FSNPQNNKENLMKNIQSVRHSNISDINLSESDFIFSEIPPNSITITTIKTLPPIPNKYVNPEVPPYDRAFHEITSLEQVWKMPLFHPYKYSPTWKFWFMLAFLVCLILCA
ncbi:1776_t:CDS:1, partial [Racocetra persica]